MTVKARTVESYLDAIDADLPAIIDALREVVTAADPRLREVLKWGQPAFVLGGNVCYISAMRGYVNLGFFKGAHLEDDSGRIKGTGKDLRHVKVRRLDEIDRVLFIDLIRAAVALDEAG